MASSASARPAAARLRSASRAHSTARAAGSASNASTTGTSGMMPPRRSSLVTAAPLESRSRTRSARPVRAAPSRAARTGVVPEAALPASTEAPASKSEDAALVAASMASSARQHASSGVSPDPSNGVCASAPASSRTATTAARGPAPSLKDSASEQPPSTAGRQATPRGRVPSQPASTAAPSRRSTATVRGCSHRHAQPSSVSVLVVSFRRTRAWTEFRSVSASSASSIESAARECDAAYCARAASAVVSAAARHRAAGESSSSTASSSGVVAAGPSSFGASSCSSTGRRSSSTRVLSSS
mmetsp:Transcript_15252/g.61320  ORF Transcript_15252/g.61320 Transcript_15252/m.61320 type:complete len:300 (+) Transcript_15252:2572-3471(+)